jgi:hypothetical protein
MGDFQDAVADAMQIWFSDDIADTVTYNGQDIKAHVSYEQNLNEQTGSADARAQIVVKKSDVAAPDYRDTVVIGSDTWKVRNIKEGDGYTWTLELYCDERPVL